MLAVFLAIPTMLPLLLLELSVSSTPDAVTQPFRTPENSPAMPPTAAELSLDIFPIIRQFVILILPLPSPTIPPVIEPVSKAIDETQELIFVFSAFPIKPPLMPMLLIYPLIAHFLIEEPSDVLASPPV